LWRKNRSLRIENSSSTANMRCSFGELVKFLKNERLLRSRDALLACLPRTCLGVMGAEVVRGSRLLDPAERHNNGKAIQRVLALARSLVKMPENAGLTVHIEAMKKGFKRRRHQPTPEAPAPSPQAAPVA